ncbi:Zn-dependent hydrolase [Pelistega europaea]|uniref:Zn-dependent hydrolase n=1 Tax=Pelistega europaea TaxID=106147 RepID=A0A7Y4LCN8_9BURK|nr:Zn-dependent hydrolase [Pelistega europaea]NOL50091.1 Zn-dependent hydrolase [Pelistega europaea]
MVEINASRLLDRLDYLGHIGKDGEGRLTRLALTDAEKAGRDKVVSWMKEAGLRVVVDRIGNIFGIWETTANKDQQPLMLGSHIDTVINAGKYDGCYGVLAGLEVIQRLQEIGLTTQRPIIVGAFTNEEGIRYAPDMMGSLVYAGGLSVEQALATQGMDGTILGEELDRIGYAGDLAPGFVKPFAYLELHIEQGPILEAQNITIGAVENLQGISWQRLTIKGVANHAGTTPIDMRVDAGLAAAKIIVFLRERCLLSSGRTVATVGELAFTPNAVNVIPSQATLTIDIRNTNEELLQAEEQALAQYLRELEQQDKVTITATRLVRFEPVLFDENLVCRVEQSAQRRGLSCRRMTSGAGHDAQMMARICPSAMIFVPSVKGISHNPREFTKVEDLVHGANVFLDVVMDLVA